MTTTLNWKMLSLLTVLLLAALGLQAGAIKIMINLAVESKTSAALAAANNARHAAPLSERHPPAEAVATASETKPAMPPVSDPPHLAEAPSKPTVAQHESNPEAPKLPGAPSPAAVQPSAEAALIAAEAKLQSASASRSPSQPLPAVSEQPAKPTTTVPAEPIAATEASTIAATNAEGALQEPAWLKSRNPKHYTVQLYSGKDMGTLKEIASSTASAEPQAYYSTGTRSGTWYSLVAGDYPDSAAAQVAADKFTTRSPALKPWIRRFDEIQAKLR